MFLDELIQPKPIQAKLLRVIRTAWSACRQRDDGRGGERAFHRGHQHRSRRSGRLRATREDLYYRPGVPIHAPLRAPRTSLLVATSWPTIGNGIATAVNRYLNTGHPSLNHNWPGNVREARTWSSTPCAAGPGAEDIPFIGEQKVVVETAPVDVEGPPGESYHAARERLLSAFERRYLARLVQQAGGNMSKAARIAGVDRTTLYRLMERHGLERNLLASAIE
jgi:DNA-binding NtrC family response regulator